MGAISHGACHPAWDPCQIYAQDQWLEKNSALALFQTRSTQHWKQKPQGIWLQRGQYYKTRWKEFTARTVKWVYQSCLRFRKRELPHAYVMVNSATVKLCQSKQQPRCAWCTCRFKTNELCEGRFTWFEALLVLILPSSYMFVNPWCL